MNNNQWDLIQTIDKIFGDTNGGFAFKYLPFDINVIKNICINGKLKYSTAKQLNEYGNEDFNLLVGENIIDFKELLKMYDELYDIQDHDTITHNIIDVLPDKIKNELRKELSEKIEFIRKNPTELDNTLTELDNTFNKHKEAIRSYYECKDRDNYGVLSLTTSSTSNCMWAKYANCYNGIVIQFDLNDYYFHDSDNSSIGAVEYSDLLGFAGLLNFYLYKPDSFRNIYFFQKYEKWKHEEEYRKIKPISELKEEIVNGKPIYLDCNFLPETIKSITFGPNVDKEKKEECKEMLKNNNTSKHIGLYDLEIEYKIVKCK